MRWTYRAGATQDPLADLNLCQRWQWRRIAHRVSAEHERATFDLLRQLSTGRVPVLGIHDQQLRPGAAIDAVGLVRLALPGWRLLLAGVAAAPRTALADAARRAPLRLYDAGRYGPLWWIEIASEGPAGDRGVGIVLVMLSTHLLLTPSRGGPGPVGARYESGVITAASLPSGTGES